MQLTLLAFVAVLCYIAYGSTGKIRASGPTARAVVCVWRSAEDYNRKKVLDPPPKKK